MTHCRSTIFRWRARSSALSNDTDAAGEAEPNSSAANSSASTTTVAGSSLASRNRKTRLYSTPPSVAVTVASAVTPGHNPRALPRPSAGTAAHRPCGERAARPPRASDTQSARSPGGALLLPYTSSGARRRCPSHGEHRPALSRNGRGVMRCHRSSDDDSPGMSRHKALSLEVMRALHRRAPTPAICLYSLLPVLLASSAPRFGLIVTHRVMELGRILGVYLLAVGPRERPVDSVDGHGHPGGELA